MLLIAHVVIALSSLAHGAYLYVKPTKNKFIASYTLIGVTIASGTLLILDRHVSMLRTCLMGLVYLGIVLTLTVSAHHKLTQEYKEID